MGVASITFTLAMPSASRESTCSGIAPLETLAWIAGTRLSSTIVVFPDPDTPVTTVILPTGILRSRGCTVCIGPVVILIVPRENRDSSAARLRTTGSIPPEMYGPMIEPGSDATCWTVPCDTTVPPFLPAPGPISISQSADLSALTSWSTRMTEFPCSTRSPTMAIMPSRFEGCRPIDGSSRTYITPVVRFLIALAS